MTGVQTCALPILRALAIRMQSLGADHPDTAASISHLATVYQLVGNTERALELETQALAIRERHLDYYHPDTAISLHNLASIYYNRGDVAQALPLWERALCIVEHTLNRVHPYAETFRANLEACKRALGLEQ